MPMTESQEGQTGSRFSSLWTLTDGHHGAILGISIITFLGAIAEALFLVTLTHLALAIANGAPRVELTGSVSTNMGATVAIAVALVFFRSACGYLNAELSARTSAAIGLSVRRALTAAFLSANWEMQHDERPGRLQELLGQFVTQTLNVVLSVTTAITSGVSLVALLLVATVVNPVAAAAVLVMLVALAAILAPLRRRLRVEARRATRQGMTYSTSVNEVSSLGLEIQVFGVQAPVTDRLDADARHHAAMVQRTTFLRGAVPVTFISLAYVAVAVALAMASSISSADLSSVGAVLIVMLRSLSYGQNLQVSTASVTSGLPNVDSLHDALSDYSSFERPIGDVEFPNSHSIQLRGVSFNYPGGENVLSRLDLEVAEGELLGIVGPSGAGKSTLVQLLLGLRSPTEGQVTVGGIKPSNVKHSSWTSHVSFVPQTPSLFSGTIGDNIRFFRPELSSEEIESAARAAHVFEDIIGFPKGFDSQVGERGGNLSGGQQQRICIARALATKPDLLILDEPTSSLDGRSEVLVRTTLRELAGKSTVVVIAHRLSTISLCDRIAVIDHGRIVACAPPAELERSNEFYSAAVAMVRGTD